MSTVPITPDFIQGAITIESGDGYVRPWRTDYQQKELYPSIDENLVNQMSKPVGVRVRFASTSTSVTLAVLPDEVARKFDLVIENERIDTLSLATGETTLTVGDLPGDETPVEVWLPYDGPVSLATIDGEGVRSVSDTRLKWLTYGSSITQCGAAHSPSRTWPAIAARACDLNLTCMGLGGQCHLDSMVARLIRDRDADLLTMKLGINVMGAASLSPRSFRGAVIGFTQIIREKHPTMPIGIISPIISPPREATANAVGFTLEMMRDELADVVDRIIQVTGDEKIYYFNGLEMFGENLVDDYLPDNLHPNGDGYEILGNNAAVKVLPQLLTALG